MLSLITAFDNNFATWLMRPLQIRFLVVILLLVSLNSFGQLQINTNTTASALAQKLVGDGVVISNATLTTNSFSTAFFNNRGNTNIAIDSGIVLTNGRAKSLFPSTIGLNGDGFRVASIVRADANLGLPGDIDLANELRIPITQLNDAIALEFDFIPLGDSIKFNYIMSSEEYTTGTVCVFNDAFAFFISGPGIIGNKNIALIPGTNTPVTIRNVNNITTAACVNNPQYYIDNTSNVYFTHEGHTTLFTASSQVQPCQTYHLKLVVADQGDHSWDTGVFLEAGSLRSDPVKFDGHTPINEINLPYLAEGCVSGAIHVIRNQKKPFAQTLNLSYAGTATNGLDVTLLPPTITIPANDSVAILPINAIADLVPEGIETLKIYIGNSCASIFSDSIVIELRDIDMLTINPADSVLICRNNPVQLDAVTGYLNYTWSNGTTLSNSQIYNPVATPVTALTNYICTATIGNCIARDSVLIKWKTISVAGKTDVPCFNGSNGTISLTGTGWTDPVYAINNGTYQAGNSFSNLPVGTYWLKMKDASGCVDSIPVTLIQSFPDLAVSALVSQASCSGLPDGTVQMAATGGNSPYQYSSDGTNFQPGNSFQLNVGSYNATVKDNNGCLASRSVFVPLRNLVTVDAGEDAVICEGGSHTIPAVSNGTSFQWTPASTLGNASLLSPTASPTVTTKYFVTATTGICTRTDSVTIAVRPAPIAEAGENQAICYGITAQLGGSGGIDYQWSSDPTFISTTTINNPVVKPSVTSTYYLHVKDIFGCQSLQADNVTIKVTPSVKVFAGNDTLVAINQPLQLNAIELNNSGVDTWEWSATSYLSNPFIAAPVATFPSPVSTVPYEYVYTVTGKTPEGCEGSDIIKIKVYKGPEIYVPTGFTPNGDGKNDLLIPLSVGLKSLKFFRVYNRWGQMVFYSESLAKGWDGRIMGMDQPTGVYIWIAEGIDYMGKTVSGRGTTTLIR
jgi:gliding motility-associated-like protein